MKEAVEINLIGRLETSASTLKSFPSLSHYLNYQEYPLV